MTAAKKLDEENEFITKNKQINGFTKNQRQTDLNSVKSKMEAKGWSLVDYNDDGMMKSYATFKRPTSYKKSYSIKEISQGIVGLVFFIGFGSLFSGGPDSAKEETTEGATQAQVASIEESNAYEEDKTVEQVEIPKLPAEGIKLSIETIKEYGGIKDLSVEQSDRDVTIGLMIKRGVTVEKARELGDNLIRQLMVTVGLPL